MICSMDDNLLYTYEDGSIDPLEKIFIEEHIKHCDKCRAQLKMIKTIDDNLKIVENEFPVSDRLSIISEMTAENCIEGIEAEKLGVKLQNYKESMKSIGKIIIRSRFARNNNPYNKAIRKCVEAASKMAVKPAKKYINKKISKLNLLKMLKVG